MPFAILLKNIRRGIIANPSAGFVRKRLSVELIFIGFGPIFFLRLNQLFNLTYGIYNNRK